MRVSPPYPPQEAQIQEFKEAFNFIDQNHDGYIDEEDLREMYSSLGELGCGSLQRVPLANAFPINNA